MTELFGYLFGSAVSKAYGVFTGVMSELTFLAICVAGAIICGASLVFGGDDGDLDMGHHVEIGHGHDSDGHDQGPGMLSIRGLSLLATGFGGFGFLAFHYTGKPLFASLMGLASGLLFTFLGLLVLRVLLRQESNSLIGTSAIIGLIGIVTVSIPKDGLGEVTLTVEGHQLTRTAAAEGSAIKHGMSVRVLSSSGGTIMVEPAIGAATHS
ncbi:MAG: NfeD family protein [Candidatus Azambacteria bacterium]|nr:NfeD family protein [Candidatus Azambacteria bacterium]